MSKKEQVIELFKNGSSVEDVLTETSLSQSYVYRIKREIDESNGDQENVSETKGDNTDGVVIDNSGGTGDDVETNDEVVESKEKKRETDKNNGLGGIKKTKKEKKKTVKSSKEESNGQKESTEHNRIGGIKEWIVQKWKTMLLILSASVLLMMMIVYLLKMKLHTQEDTMKTTPPRFPTLTY